VEKRAETGILLPVPTSSPGSEATIEPRRLFLAALALAALVSFTGLDSHALWTPDEPRDAAIGLDMARSGDYVVPRLDGERFLEKPPLYWWVEAATYRALGASDATARLPSAVFGFLTLLVAFALGARIGGPAAGLLATAALATTAEFNETMHRAVVDPALTFFVAVTHLGLVLALAPRSPHERRVGSALVAVAVPLAFLSKGVVGPGLALGPTGLYLLATRQFRAIGRAWPIAAIGVPLFALVAGPWILALYRAEGWSGVEECLITNTFGRMSAGLDTKGFGHQQPVWYYLVNGPGHLAPWIVALPAMLTRPFDRADERERETRRMLFATFGIGIAMLSVPSGKRGLYLVPLMPAFAAVAGAWLAEVGRGAARALDRGTMLLLLGAEALAPLVALGAALVARFRPPASIADLAPLRAALSTRLIFGLGLAAAVVAFALAVRLLAHIRAGTAPRPVEVLVPLVLGFVAFQTGGKALLDPVKTLHPLAAAIARTIPPEEDVLVFEPREVIRGIVRFDLGRHVAGVYDPAELGPRLEAGPAPGWLVYEKRAESRIPKEVLERLEPVYSEVGRSAQPYVIAVFRTAAPPKPPKEGS
jgi:4-amino-4-deoxy-L-arabinose transferase-like glycosyltransferase